MNDRRKLLLLRHAEAEATRAGHHDRDRRLTETGHDQARAVGAAIRSDGWDVDHVCCSPAVRTRETLADLDLPSGAEVEVLDTLYNGGADSILEQIRSLPADVRTVLVLGHAPGIPAVLYELTDPQTADPLAWQKVASRFPPTTLAVLELSTSWDDLL